MDDRANNTLEAARLITDLLEKNKIEYAIIGAMAMAAHGYARETSDLDIGTATDPFRQLKEIEDILKDKGFKTELITPDAEDPIGGVLNIERDDIDLIQIVNFYNPFAPVTSALGVEAITNSQRVNDSSFRIAGVEYLVALKLYAGGFGSKIDAIELLKANPDFDKKLLIDITDKFELKQELAEILPEIQ